MFEYLEAPPEIGLEVYEDHTREILSHNDSPDLGFRYSINPYRGCFHACAYCLAGDTAVAMADGSARPIAALAVGDRILGTQSDGDGRRYVATEVLAHWATVEPAYRVVLRGGVSLIAGAEHRFLTSQGWKHVASGEAAPSLVPGDRLLGGDPASAVERRPLEPALGPLVEAVEALGRSEPMYDITTGTGDFIAGGVVSHNCYARPTHEYLSFGSGVDFERKIVIKPHAAELLREAFERPAWRGELLMFSGNTDCYQPLEASYRLTQSCLEVCAEYANPFHVITKSPLIERDLELLVRSAERTSVGVSVSIPFWDEANARAIEPYVATPRRRIKTVQRLAEAGIDVTVNVAPLIPGLTDRDMPKIMEAAAEAGARRAALVVLRLPGTVKQVFEERLREALPLGADKVLARTREMRGGKLYDSRFGARMAGSGTYADAIHALFEQTARRLGLNRERARPVADTFRRPPRAGEQLDLFRRG